jgi:hypothetical protein
MEQVRVFSLSRQTLLIKRAPIVPSDVKLFDYLYDDLLLYIASFLDTRALCNLSKTCKRMRDICWHDALWKSLALGLAAFPSLADFFPQADKWRRMMRFNKLLMLPLLEHLVPKPLLRSLLATQFVAALAKENVMRDDGGIIRDVYAVKTRRGFGKKLVFCIKAADGKRHRLDAETVFVRPSEWEMTPVAAITYQHAKSPNQIVVGVNISDQMTSLPNVLRVHCICHSPIDVDRMEFAWESLCHLMLSKKDMDITFDETIINDARLAQIMSNQDENLECKKLYRRFQRDWINEERAMIPDPGDISKLYAEDWVRRVLRELIDKKAYGKIYVSRAYPTVRAYYQGRMVSIIFDRQDVIESLEDTARRVELFPPLVHKTRKQTSLLIYEANSPYPEGAHRYLCAFIQHKTNKRKTAICDLDYFTLQGGWEEKVIYYTIR